MKHRILVWYQCKLTYQTIIPKPVRNRQTPDWTLILLCLPMSLSRCESDGSLLSIPFHNNCWRRVYSCIFLTSIFLILCSDPIKMSNRSKWVIVTHPRIFNILEDYIFILKFFTEKIGFYYFSTPWSSVLCTTVYREINYFKYREH